MSGRNTEFCVDGGPCDQNWWLKSVKSRRLIISAAHQPSCVVSLLNWVQILAGSKEMKGISSVARSLIKFLFIEFSDVALFATTGVLLMQLQHWIDCMQFFL